MDTHNDVCIVLKKSLKWVPIVGWVRTLHSNFLTLLTSPHVQGMQFFRFIFLARSWASDSLYLVKQLSLLGKRAQDHDTPLTFILYPEGTLVSPDTRPVSKKFADKLGIVSSISLLITSSLLIRIHSLTCLTHSSHVPQACSTVSVPSRRVFLIFSYLILPWDIPVRHTRFFLNVTISFDTGRSSTNRVRSIVLHLAIDFLR
jgi:hypothetical protein